MGDTEFRELYLRYRPKVIGYMRAYFEAAEAEDAAQAVFMAVWRNRAAYDRAKSAPSTWLMRIARNLAYDWRLARGRRSRAEAAAAAGAGGAGLTEPTPEEIADLEVLLQHLESGNRKILIMRFAMGYSNREIAQRLSLSEAVVAKRIERALKTLRSHPVGTPRTVHKPPRAQE